MSPSELLLRWSGLAAALGGVLFSAKILWEVAGVVPLNTTDITDTLFFIVSLLWLAGLQASMLGAQNATGLWVT